MVIMERITGDFDPEFEMKRQRGIELNRSSRLDYHLWSEAEEVDALVEDLHKRFVDHTKPKRIHRKVDLSNLKVLILNLFRAYTLRPDWYVAWSRRFEDYRFRRGRYNPANVSRKMIELATALDELDFVETVKGYYDKNKPYRSKSSRVRATPKLIAKFINEYSLNSAMVVRHAAEETIILKQPRDKHGKAKLDHYIKDTPDTIRWRKNLTKINKVLHMSSIELRLTDQQWDDLNTRLIATKDEHKRKEPLDTTRVRLRRIFNDSSWEHGGRFYGGWWQNVFRDYRSNIWINGLPTTEVDYSSLHPRMLYAKDGLMLPKDCYAIKGLGYEHRGAIKAALLRMLNADRKEAAWKSLLYSDEADLVKAVPDGVKGLLKMIEDTHQQISHYFYSDVGKKLQYLDSQVAESVMLHFVNKEIPIPVLPIHDSFIVPCFFRDELIAVMEAEFEKMFHAVGLVEVKEERLRFFDLSYLLIGNS